MKELDKINNASNIFDTPFWFQVLFWVGLVVVCVSVNYGVQWLVRWLM